MSLCLCVCAWYRYHNAHTRAYRCRSHHPRHPTQKLLGFRAKPVSFTVVGTRFLTVVGTSVPIVVGTCSHLTCLVCVVLSLCLYFVHRACSQNKQARQDNSRQVKTTKDMIRKTIPDNVRQEETRQQTIPDNTSSQEQPGAARSSVGNVLIQSNVISSSSRMLV